MGIFYVFRTTCHFIFSLHPPLRLTSVTKHPEHSLYQRYELEQIAITQDQQGRLIA